MDNRNHFFYYLILFLISPILAVIASMANFKHRNARLTMILFVASFGYTMIIRPGADVSRHVMRFVEYYQYIDFMEFSKLMASIINLEGGKTLGAGADELYLPILSYSLAQFTNSPSILLLVVGLVYGTFFIHGISLLYDDMHRNWNIVLLVLFVFFISYKSFEGINSIRNWTGAWCFFNGAYLYLRTRNVKYILLVMLAPMFHAGYLAITLPFYAYLFIGDRKYLLLGILAISFMFSTSLGFIEPYLMSTGLGEAKLDAYAVESGEEWRGGVDNRNFHAKYYGTIGGWTIRVLFVYSLFSMGFVKDKNHDTLRTGLAGLAILMFSMSNLAGFAPVLAARVFVNFGLIALAYLVLHYSKLQPGPGMQRNIVYAAIPGILLFVFTQYSQIGDFMDFKALLSPLLYPFLGDDPVSIKEFIRELFL